jgi:hypothetical protein
LVTNIRTDLLAAVAKDHDLFDLKTATSTSSGKFVFTLPRVLEETNVAPSSNGGTASSPTTNHPASVRKNKKENRLVEGGFQRRSIGVQSGIDFDACFHISERERR